MAPVLSRKKVDVTFNPLGLTDPEIPLFTFSGDIVLPEKTIEVDEGIGMLVLELFTATGEREALFQTDPIQWFDPANPDVPILAPHMFVVQRIGDHMVTIIDFNSALVETPHRFNVVVAYGGNTYGTDPTIINMPPDSGGVMEERSTREKRGRSARR